MNKAALREWRRGSTAARRGSWLAGILLALASSALVAGDWTARLDAWSEPPWTEPLRVRLAALESDFSGELGVHVRELGGGARLGWRDDETWYLASLVKVPIAIELMSRVEAGEMSLQDRMTLRRDDYVDGAGPTNWAPPGSRLPLRRLLESMVVVSDNTASDMLIRHLGLESVNRRAQRLAQPGGLGPITTLLDVRRHVHANVHPAAVTLDGMDFIELRQQSDDAGRRAWLRQRLGPASQPPRAVDLDQAFHLYYATGLNAGRLVAFADVLEALADGHALGPQASAELLAVMARTTSGDRRLKAGLGRDIRLAHKTGTQHRRVCDAGIAGHAQGPARRLIIVACVRGESDLARSERVLAEIGRAIREAGALGDPQERSR